MPENINTENRINTEFFNKNFNPIDKDSEDLKEIGRYRIVEKIGEGAVGKVYKAYDPVLEREVALKVLFSEISRRKEAILRFNREAKCNAQLNHNNIVSSYDFPCIDKKYFLVMQYINGFSLEELLDKKRGKISLKKSCKIILDILDAMEYTHTKRIIHRDLKPSNILLDKKGNIFVTDFGIAKAFLETSTVISQPGTVLGTPTYMAPEQIKPIPGFNLDARCDIYSIGVIFYELLTGRPPFWDANVLKLLYKITHDEIPPLKDIKKDIPDKIQEICLKSLEKDISKRYQRAKNMQEDILKYFSEKKTEKTRNVVFYIEEGTKKAKSINNKKFWLRTLSASILFIFFCISIFYLISNFIDDSENSKITRNKYPNKNIDIPEKKQNEKNKKEIQKNESHNKIKANKDNNKTNKKETQKNESQNKPKIKHKTGEIKQQIKKDKEKEELKAKRYKEICKTILGMDKNRDWRISSTEWRGKYFIFQVLDKNKDNILSPEEWGKLNWNLYKTLAKEIKKEKEKEKEKVLKLKKEKKEIKKYIKDKYNKNLDKENKYRNEIEKRAPKDIKDKIDKIEKSIKDKLKK